MNWINYLPLLAGIGLFLYGMDLLGKSLERLAGAKMEKTLEKLTDNPIKGVLLGTGVTGVIQSSSATTIMVIGLLNAGIFTLVQAFPVIMGANIGTTVTGQLLRLGDINSSASWLSILKPSSLGAFLAIVGACIVVFSKVNQKRTIGNLLMGLGMIFFGMTTMEKTLAPLGQTEWFQNMLIMFRNPLLGILIGALMTSALQSSSASVGILQALSTTGLITWSSAIPLILGQNIGKCVTVLLATFNSGKDSKRAVFLHLFINVIGLVLFSVFIYGANAIFHFTFWDTAVNRGNIADFHTLFSVITVIAILPFNKLLIKLSQRLIKDDAKKEQTEAEIELGRLNEFFISTPSIALEQARKVVIQMGRTAIQSLKLAYESSSQFDPDKINQICTQETFLDKAESQLNNYILKITPHRLTEAQSNMSSEMLHNVVNFERIGDHCVNIMDVAKYNRENNVTYSPQAQEELRIIFSATNEILETTVRIYEDLDGVGAKAIAPYEDVLDELQEKLRDRHIDRLKDGLCNVPAGISFLEILSNLERVSDHCVNIAKTIIQEESKDATAYQFHDSEDASAVDYKRTYETFKQKYAIPEE